MITSPVEHIGRGIGTVGVIGGYLSGWHSCGEWVYSMKVLM